MAQVENALLHGLVTVLGHEVDGIAEYVLDITEFDLAILVHDFVEGGLVLLNRLLGEVDAGLEDVVIAVVVLEGEIKAIGNGQIYEN